MLFEQELAKRSALAEDVLRRWLPTDEIYNKTVVDAMIYSVTAGGKRLRPMLMQQTYAMMGGTGILVEPFMAALESIHNYSLVHDDLPCMDDDEYRRGRLTTHAVYGEGMAVLAGDGLLNWAFEVAAESFVLAAREDNPAQAMALCARALKILAAKAGIHGMIGGQCADVEAEERPDEEITEELLLYIHENKTAALIEAAMMIGAVLAGAEEEEIAKFEAIGSKVGLAFQIQDDILDLTGTMEELGKPIGSDEKNHKVTYVTLHGLENSRKAVKKLSEEALQMVHELNRTGDSFVEELISSLITRRK